MTNKEQIIIDGKGCRYKTWDAECSLTGDHYGDNMKPCKFIDEKSCYFKQLARKTQECEELKEQLQANQPTGICETCMANAILQNDKYRKALEEIKEIVSSTLDCGEWVGQGDDKMENILDIINKAKDGNNER